MEEQRRVQEAEIGRSEGVQQNPSTNPGTSSKINSHVFVVIMKYI
jgi:hypothetical protein